MPRTLPRATGSAITAILCAALATVSVSAADWPMWRYDTTRTAATPEELPASLHLQWTLELPVLEPAWLDEDRMEFDLAYEPIISDGLLLIASPREDTVTAYEAESGRLRWRFFTDGPVRLAPVVWRGKLYLGSDDGHLYCLDVHTGRELWRFNATPESRLCIGNKRLISTWPLRGAPVVAEGRIYFASGIWPFMGVFIYCLDADTGEQIWLNDSTGSVFMLQPHTSPAFGAIAPQGYMVLNGNRLIVPGGRSTPACFDAETGEMLYYRLAEFSKMGSYAACSQGGLMFNAGGMWDLPTGLFYGQTGPNPVLTAETLYHVNGGRVTAMDLAKVEKAEKTDEKGNTSRTLSSPRIWRTAVEADRVWLKAGSRLYSSRGTTLSATDASAAGEDCGAEWEMEVDGTPLAMAAADGRLYVSTLEGKVHCYGGEPVAPTIHAPSPTAAADVPDRWAQRAAETLEGLPSKEGYCLVLGCRDGWLAEELARQSDLHVVAIGPDRSQMEEVRQRLQTAGLYGARVSTLVGETTKIGLPAYLATLIAVEDPAAAGMADPDAFYRTTFFSLRPYGGEARLPVPATAAEAELARIGQCELAGAEVSARGDLVVVRRAGPLPDTGQWVGQYGSMANTCVSEDDLVRAPLGLLWYGGSSNQNILPRHGHGPPQQVLGGRLFIEGPDSLRATDVYTGRVLWEVELPGIGDAYNYTTHEPGANAVGTNFFVTEDLVYVAYGQRCLCLDPATGGQVSELTLPVPSGETEPPAFGYIGVSGDLLVAGSEPMIFEGEQKIGKSDNWDGTASRRLVVMDRHSGEPLWQVDAGYSFRHNAIAAGGGRLYLIDSLPDVAVKKLQRRGEEADVSPRMLCLDMRSGETLWETTDDVFGTWLGYSERHDLLIQGGRPSRDMLPNEPGDRMIAYRAATGEILWDQARNYYGPPLLHGDRIITQAIDMRKPGMALDILTGERLDMADPLTGEEVPWEYGRNYGCNTVIAGSHLITFRSAAAGYYDLDTHSGTGNLGGFKSGCTSNLVIADGLLNAPDYTRTCICSYQNQTSLALIHAPDVEMWTFNMLQRGDGPVRSVGVNLGAPGDRVDGDGVLWLEYPVVGGPSPELAVEVRPDSPHWFQNHSSRYASHPLRWVAASGVEGPVELSVSLAEESAAPRRYDVLLCFAEPEAIEPGKRVFDVLLQGQVVEESLDIIGRTEKPRTALLTRYEDVEIGEKLTLALRAAEGSARPPLLCGVRVVAR